MSLPWIKGVCTSNENSTWVSSCPLVVPLPPKALICCDTGIGRDRLLPSTLGSPHLVHSAVASPWMSLCPPKWQSSVSVKVGKWLCPSQGDGDCNMVKSCTGMKHFAVLVAGRKQVAAILQARSGQDIFPSEGSEMGLRSGMNLKLTLCLWEDTVCRKCFVSKSVHVEF